MIDDLEPGALALGEPHPAAQDANQWLLEYVKRNPLPVLFNLLESFSSAGLSGNRLGEVCGETLRRVLDRQAVSDRYMLGLVWTIREMESQKGTMQ